MNSSEKDNVRWVTEGDDINPEQIGELLFNNASIDEFLKSDSKKFVVASKGIGKTLLLKRKRFILEKRYASSCVFIPTNKPYLDFANEDLAFLAKNEIGILSDVKTTKMIWQISLIASVFNYVKRRNNSIVFNDVSLFPKWFMDIVNSESVRNPCHNFVIIIRSAPNVSSIVVDLKKYYTNIVNSCRDSIGDSIYIFIDRIDQALRDTPKEYWIAMQAGLLEAAWDLNRINKHIKTYCSIRQEAYDNAPSFVHVSISGNVSLISYTKEELVEMINQLSHYYDGKPFSSLLGMKGFEHPKTGYYESVEDYIIRHTLYRPRDFVAIIGKFNKNKKITQKQFRKVVNEQSTLEIANNIFEENNAFLKSLKKEDDRAFFYSLIPYNVMSKSTMIKVCAKFNRKRKCLQDGCSFPNKCAHPFSELYNLGLLGIVDMDNVLDKDRQKQQFKKPDNIKDFDENSLPMNSEYYFIHPCLNDNIKKMRPSNLHNDQLYIVWFIKVEDGAPWGTESVNALNLFMLLENKNYSMTQKTELKLYLRKLNKTRRKKVIEELCFKLRDDDFDLSTIYQSSNENIKEDNCALRQEVPTDLTIPDNSNGSKKIQKKYVETFDDLYKKKEAKK